MLGDIAFEGLENRVTMAAQLITMFKKCVRGLMMAQEGERRAYGVDYRQQTKEATRDEAEVRRRRELAGSILKMVDEMRRMTDACSQAVETVRRHVKLDP
ncbi:hypothetical protein [Microvirga sp. TS319]|uniref:hypothetical protein n=1 Tax=Microvirga sp. TS319 TaxID=3241165 RepID=UPI00351AA2C9